MKVIFLDIDGVLNSSETFKRNRKKRLENPNQYILNIDEEKVTLLGDICKATSAKVVLSSAARGSWENGPSHLDDKFSINLQKLFDKYEIEIIGITPVVGSNKYSSHRELEIMVYLKNHPEIDSFCIIDDEICDLESLKDFVIKTKWNPDYFNDGGLQENHVNEAIKVLTRN